MLEIITMEEGSMVMEVIIMVKELVVDKNGEEINID